MHFPDDVRRVLFRVVWDAQSAFRLAIPLVGLRHGHLLCGRDSGGETRPALAPATGETAPVDLYLVMDLVGRGS